MHNVKIENIRKVTCNLSADQWQLYTNIFERDEIENVANKLNSIFNELVKNGYTKTQSLNIMLDSLKHYNKYGANDTEPRCVLEQLLEYVYGKD